ncbi:MAG: Calx-beta domain-containing protein [Gemmataceae bacterium]
MSPRTSARLNRTRLAVEPLECRDVPSALSVSDVTVREGATATGVLDPTGAAAVGLNETRAFAFDTNLADAHYGDLFVVSSKSNSVVRFDWATQTYQPFIASGRGGLSKPSVPVIGPDGNLYVNGLDQQNGLTQAIFRYDGSTGAPLPAPGRSGAVYVEDDPGTPNVDESGGLGTASWGSGFTFGADGNLYSGCGNQAAGVHQILRFQGPNGPSPGAFLDVFVNITNMANGPNDVVLGPDGSLYANGGGVSNDLIDRFDGTTGAPIGNGVFVAPQSGGLSNSRKFVIDPAGQYLYIANFSAGQILRFQGPNNATPGAFVDTYITQGQSGLTYPIGVALDPAGNMYVGERDANRITRFAPNAVAAFTVTLNSPSSSAVTVNYATANGTTVAGTDYTATFGTLTFAPGETSKTVVVPITSVLTGGPTKTFTLNLSAASGATVADGQGVGSILNRQTKFFVADGGTVKTYQYGSGGTSEEITVPQLSSNTAPRGIASTAAGDKTWVVDANKTVYVYTSHGVLLGSWTAGSLSSSAVLTGITTNGTDIWLVDRYADKVYKYANAAGRLSGSQTAASSFKLNRSDSNPTDIVTDGTSFWVVDDGGSTDTVFKYTLSGSLVGSWTMTGGGGSPTGITLDPTGASQDLWVVDNATDTVYRYAAARSRTSGSQAAAETFALNPFDTNPQGIADPPPAGGQDDDPASWLSVALPGNLMNGTWGPPVQPAADLTRREVRVPAPVAPAQPLAEERLVSASQSDGPDAGFDLPPLFAAVDADAILEPVAGRAVIFRW